MNGPIAQVVALAMHGNAFLSGAAGSDFLASNSTAQHCQSIVFVQEEQTWFGLGQAKVVEFSTAEQWLENIKTRGALRLGVRWISGKDSAPDRMLAAFVGGGGTWTMQVQLADGNFEQWVGEWSVEEARRKVDGKIWRVRYRRAHAGRESLPAGNLAEAKSALERALADTQAFSARKDLKPFTGMFEKALGAVRGEPGFDAYHRDLSPRPLPAKVNAVLNACQHAWVFGGMGSWNDMGFDGDDNKEYDRVSDALFTAVVQAIPAAVDAAAEESESGPDDVRNEKGHLRV